MPLTLTDEQVAQLAALGVLAGDTSAPPADPSVQPAPPAPSDVPASSDTSTSTDSVAAQVADLNAGVSAPPVAVRSIVSHNVTQGWTHQPVTRYGIVTAVHDPAIVGTDDKGADVSKVHADVAWFGGDGLTTVPVDELAPIG